MNKQTEALKLAEDALKRVRTQDMELVQLSMIALAAIKEALAEQPAQQEPVACIIGTKGSAFDLPTAKRAYTYAEQPGNVVAYKIGRACEAAMKQSAWDGIDRGLAMLQELQKEGLGVFDLGAEYAAHGIKGDA